VRVLLLHNRYRLQGGEERAVEDIAWLLSSRGHDVEVGGRPRTAHPPTKAARGLISGGIEADAVGAAVRRFRADVVHAHNLHPSFGWRALSAARDAGARTVLHLHNFRLFCAIAIAYRDGERCFRCHHGNTLPGLRLRCRGSLVEAAVYAAGLSRQWARLLEHADALVTVSQATTTRLEALGLPTGRAATLPNFVRSDRVAEGSRADVGSFVLTSGRLVEEKGLDMAIVAAQRAQVPLVIAGTGPDEDRLRSLADGSVEFTGLLEPDALADLRSRAAVVLAPSRWEEPCPYSVLDALASGVPVLGSELGGLPELLDPQSVLPARDHDAWTAALERLWAKPALRAERGRHGIERVRADFGEDSYLDRLLELYEGTPI
jgi:glycosyltransferase involved in cell wall biosynthesis